MQRLHSQLLLAATDLVNFHECEHLTALDRAALDDKSLKAQRTKPDEQAELFFRKGNEFEASYLEDLKREYAKPGQVVEIAKQLRNPAASAAQTLAAMQAGAEIIYQATFLDGDLVGHADFLRKVPRPSALGDYSYEIIDTKLGRHAKATYVLQLAFYGDLLAKVQQAEPHQMHVVLGTREQVSFTCNDYNRYFRRLLQRFKTTLAGPPTDTYPTPCEKCGMCAWAERCEQQRIDDDSLHLVADIRRSQVQKLEEAGVTTLEQLANLKPSKNDSAPGGAVAHPAARAGRHAAARPRDRPAAPPPHRARGRNAALPRALRRCFNDLARRRSTCRRRPERSAIRELPDRSHKGTPHRPGTEGSIGEPLAPRR